MIDGMLAEDLAALGQVLLVDLALAGDNAVVVGMAVAGLPESQQRRAIAIGIAGATVIRVALGAVTLRLLDIIGLTLAGGILLLWVCWKMFRELHRPGHLQAGPGTEAVAKRKSLPTAMLQIILADLSMSLDNVLAVAGAAEGRTWVLVVGLSVSVALMGIAAGLIASLLNRHRWIAWAGLAIVFYVAVEMIWDGSFEVAATM